MGLFSKKRKDIELPKDAFQWATNAPSHWPHVFSTLITPGQTAFNDLLEFSGNVVASFDNVPNCPVRIDTFGPSYLDKRGVVEAPLRFVDAGVKYPVYFFPQSNPEAAARFAGIQEYFNSRGITPIFYSPQPLPPAGYSSSPFVILDPSHFSKWMGDLPDRAVMMWWTTDEQKKFSGSECALDIDRMMRALDGYCTYFLGAFARVMEMVSKDTMKVYLPEKTVTICLKGPEERLIALSADREQGVRFHFDSMSTLAQYRDAFWHQMADVAEKVSIEWKKRNYPIDRPQDREWIHHWDATVRAIRRCEEQEGAVGIELGLLFP